MSNTFLLEENGETINNSYQFIKEENLDLYHKSNAHSFPPLVNSLNQNLKKMNFIQNQYNVLNNLNQEALVKKEQLLRLHNDDLAKQLSILDNIQGNISNKDRIIDQTNLSIENYDLNIKLSIVAIILSVILFFVVLLYGNSVISYSILSFFFIGIMILYLFILMCIFNTLNFRTALKKLLNKDLLREAAYEIKYLGDKAYSNLEKEENKIKSEWLKANCNCPVEEEGTPLIYALDGNKIIPEIPGVFYYDGTAPQQLLLPEPIPIVLDLHQQIDWPDYSPDGSMKYYPEFNDILYTNNQYYNYKNNKAPLIMESTNFITGPLSSPITFTTNL